MSRYTVMHGLVDAPTQYALIENARRATTGLGPAEHLRRMAELFAAFSEVAAANPVSDTPIQRTGDELITSPRASGHTEGIPVQDRTYAWAYNLE
ncbi:hypothetical protein [Mycobacterium gastri]|uniref:Uncharacterized protein n=1 Tax=Mycobacterium gastri TaxID=1777 RepID=A0A1X1UV65_MYCGS|nr:hypothetical protein [Mycobacterium gastri]ETW26221.1 hypothetical protein MGAST_28645 [Mycobacterium gastri 'Wayne']ORV60706.1 hypothetical protein AWC07_18080 [Mycobacterium gastri]